MDIKNSGYYDCLRPEMMDFIPSGCKKTIEFGCSNGNFSKDIKKHFNTESWGVDINPEASKKAAQVLDKVITGDANIALEQLPENYFDLVICNDFLEHIIDPTSFLKNIKPYVTDSAILVCSLPNVRYWKNLKELIFDKDWRYRELGILDSTHLRFFTKKSMLRMIHESGLKIKLIKGINPTKSFRFFIPNILTLGIHNDMKYLQFAIQASFAA